jgi:hypothetical protein
MFRPYGHHQGSINILCYRELHNNFSYNRRMKFKSHWIHWKQCGFVMISVQSKKLSSLIGSAQYSHIKRISHIWNFSAVRSELWGYYLKAGQNAETCSLGEFLSVIWFNYRYHHCRNWTTEFHETLSENHVIGIWTVVDIAKFSAEHWSLLRWKMFEKNLKLRFVPFRKIRIRWPRWWL